MKHFKDVAADLIDRAIASGRFKSRRDFIRVAEHTDNEDGAATYLRRVLAGRKPAPLDRVVMWADALELCGDERERFMDLAVKSHANAAVLALIGRLERENADLRRSRSGAQPSSAADELDRIMNPDAHSRPPAPTYPRPAPVSGKTPHGR